MQIEVYKTFMQIRLLLFLLCVFLMAPIDGHVKAGNGEDTLYYVGRTFNPNSSIGRNNHSLLLKTNAVAWGMAVMNVAVEYDISPVISVLIPFLLFSSQLFYFFPQAARFLPCSPKCVIGSGRWMVFLPVCISALYCGSICR